VNTTPQPVRAGRWRRRLIRGLGALIALYALVVGALLSFENRLLYRTHAHGGGLPLASQVPGEEVWLRSDTGEAIHAWWYAQPDSTDVILFCHGNAGSISLRRLVAGGDVAEIAAVMQASVLIFDYPGFGRSSGTPTEAGCCAAADAAYEWLVARVPAEDIVILGQSLGGGVATDLARRRPHRALVLYKTFTSIPDVVLAKFPLLPARQLMRNHFDNLAKIGACAGPVFIAHGERDSLIPPRQAERLFAAAAGPKEFFLMRDCGHHGGIHREFLERLQMFLATLPPRAGFSPPQGIWAISP
jgi:fermentation-respiration switch protein FrsA (DUF1100 family)